MIFFFFWGGGGGGGGRGRRFALSSNSVCMTFKPNTIIINHQLEFSVTRVKNLDYEKRAHKHDIWSYRISAKASNNGSFWRVQRD